MKNNNFYIKYSFFKRVALSRSHSQAFFTIALFSLMLSAQQLSAQCKVLFSQCPKDTTFLDCHNGSGINVSAYPPVSAYMSGNCLGYNLVMTQIAGPTLPTQFPYGTYFIQYLAYLELNGQQTGIQATCSFFLTIAKDPQAPVFQYCPPPITVHGILDGNGNCTAVGQWPLPIVSDNCDQNTSMNLQSNIPCGADLTVGTHTIIYTATDGVGNSSTCSFTVTVLCISGTSGPGALPYTFQVYPNPNSGVFTVALPESAGEGIRFRITDLAGKTIQETGTKPGDSLHVVDASRLPAGLYFLQAVLDGQVLGVEKIVRE